MSVLKKTVLLCALAAAVVVAQGQEKVFPPSAEQKAEIHKKLAELSARIAALGRTKTDPAASGRRADLPEGRRLHPAVPGGVLRAGTTPPRRSRRSISASAAPSSSKTARRRGRKKTGNVVRGFVSRIDGSVQPYGLTIPASYDGSRPMRLDVWLHGTQQQTQRSALHAAAGGAARDLADSGGGLHSARAVRADEPLVPVLRARPMSSRRSPPCSKHYNIDAERIVIRGHSMGGHRASARLAFSIRRSSRAFEASAGYSETQGVRAATACPKRG